jgi:hypothetical protein
LGPSDETARTVVGDSREQGLAVHSERSWPAEDILRQFDEVEFVAAHSYAEVCSWVGVIMTSKDTVRALLDRLPEDCSLDDIQYHLYVVQAVARGGADEEAGRTIPHEQVDAELRRKWLIGRAE